MTNRAPRRITSSILVLAGLLAGAVPLRAAEADDIGQSPEIIVTARGRSEALQRVPDTVTVFDAEAIAARRLETLDDAIAATPGVFIINDQDPGTNLISIRGVSTNRNQQPSIAFIVDGLALPDSELFTLRPYDVRRIEVLKGPQGALFGRSASGGVINLVTTDPGDQWGGTARIGYGNGDSWTADAAIDAPLNEAVALRLAGSYRNSDGFIRNTFLDQLVDGQISRNLRLKARSALGPDTVLKLRVGFADEEGGAAYISSGNVTGLFGGRLKGAALTNPFGDFEGRASRQWWGVQGTLEQELGGGYRLSWTVGYDDYEKQFVEELDFRNDTPVTLFGAPLFPDGIQPISQPVDLTALTSEVRVVSPDEAPLRWIAGVFYQRVNRDRTDDFGPLLFGAEAPRAETRSRQIGVFAQASVDVTSELEATLALRYDRDRRKEDTVGVTSGTVFAQRAATFDQWQPKLSLAWRPSDVVTAYATGALGFKAGGFNPLPGPADIWQPVFPSERTKALELGLKAQALNGRLSLSLAGFVTDYENFQNTVFLGNSVVLSVPEVDVHGLEASASLWLGSGFRLDTGVAYTRSRVGAYRTPNPTPEPGEPLVLDLAGNRTPNAPDWTLNAGAGWEGRVGAVQIDARIDARYVSRVDFEIDNILYTPGYTSVDGRIALTRGAISWDIWAKNLFDTRWAISAFGQQQLPLLLGLGPGGPFDSFTINMGRQIGTSLAVQF